MGVRGRGEGGGGSGGSVGGCPRDGDATSCRQSRVMEHFFLCVQIYEGNSSLCVRVFLCKHMTIQHLQLLAIYLSLSIYFQALITPSLLADKSIRPPLNASPAEEEEEE